MGALFKKKPHSVIGHLSTWICMAVLYFNFQYIIIFKVQHLRWYDAQVENRGSSIS
jgi:hypothetical protein